jgi:hypothetical protein
LQLVVAPEKQRLLAVDKPCASQTFPAPAGGAAKCARRPVGTYLYLHAVGAGNPIAVPGMAR